MTPGASPGTFGLSVGSGTPECRTRYAGLPFRRCSLVVCGCPRADLAQRPDCRHPTNSDKFEGSSSAGGHSTEAFARVFAANELQSHCGLAVGCGSACATDSRASGCLKELKLNKLHRFGLLWI